MTESVTLPQAPRRESHGTLHMIGNAHIDPVWLWRWQEGFQEVKATFRSALDRLSENPDFLFTCSSAAHYEWVERNDPAMFEEVKVRVAEGRWQVVGGWWVQPDCNIPAGESFARQGLIGQRYFREKFGVTATVGYNPDSFGHTAMLPQVLRLSGLTHYTFMRPGPHEKGLPARVFWWEADDGSRVLTMRIPYEYCTWGKDLEKHVLKCAGELKEPFTDLMCFYGVGNHGGGPTIENLDSIRRMNADKNFPELLFSTPDRYFEALPQDLPIPVVHDELQIHAVGCYAAHSGVKQWNRRAENALLTAEKFSSLAERITGQPYPRQDLDTAWKRVLFNQFHDILAGTSLESAYDDARDEYGQALAIAAHAQNYGVQALSWAVNVPFEEGTKPIVVFNPHAWPTRSSVELEYGGLKETDRLYTHEGDQVPLQTVHSGATVTGWRKRIAFTADLPAFGYRLYRVATRPDPRELPAVEASDTHAENEFLRLEIDSESGAVTTLLDKRSGVNLAGAKGAARLVVIRDESDTWSHGVTRYDDIAGEFALKRVRLFESGPVKAVIRVESVYNNSRVTQDFTVEQGRDQVDVAVTVDWHEKLRMLKIVFPTSLHFPKAQFEVPYGSIERPVDGNEVSGQAWIDISGVYRPTDQIVGLGVLNDAKYSFSAVGNEIALTVLRSPIYAHHDPFVPDPQGDYNFIDQGLQRFRYSLVPHAGAWERGNLTRRALELNAPAIPIIETYHEGPLPAVGSFLEVDAPNVTVTAVKIAEDGDDLIVRAFETDKVATRATFRLPFWNRSFEADFRRCEIKTFCIPRDPERPIAEVNLLEEEA